MKKYLAMGVVSLLSLSSCGLVNKNDSGNNDTSNSSGTITNTGASAGLNLEPGMETGNMTDKDSVVTYKNTEKGYQISYKKSDNLVKNDNPNVDIMVGSIVNGSNLSVITEDFSTATDVDFNKYVDVSIENLKKFLKIEDIKKEDIELNGNKGVKLSYTVSGNDNTANLVQYILQKGDSKVAYILTQSSSSNEGAAEMEEILNTFTFINS